MISVKKHYVSLINIKGTLEALERIDHLICHYGGENANKAGPAYVKFESVKLDVVLTPTVQFDRDIMVNALQAQRAKLVSYLADIGMDYDCKL